MIMYENIKAENFYTENFIASEPASMALMVSSGLFNLIEIKREEVVKPTMVEGELVDKIFFEETEITTTYNYGGFQFPIEPDDEFPVVYDVFLLAEDNGIHIDRTELGSDTICAYTEDRELLHTLCSFLVPPNTTSLEQINIVVKNIIQEEVPV